jgi:hypothetical protein
MASKSALRTSPRRFRLQGEAGRLNWLVGAFYANEVIDTTDRIRQLDAQGERLFANSAVSSGISDASGCTWARCELFNFVRRLAFPSIFVGTLNNPLDRSNSA